MLRKGTTLTLCAALVLACAGTARAQLAGRAACADVVANEGAKFFSKLMKLAGACEVKKEKGLYAPNSYCRTDFVMVTPSIPQFFADQVAKERAKLTERIHASGCPQALLAENPFDMPCGSLAGIGTSESLARCLIYDAHGQSAANLEWIVNIHQGVGRNRCRESFARGVDAHAKKMQDLYRKCAKALAVGRPCDDAALAEAVAKSRAVNVDRVVAGCGDATVFLGGFCYGSYATAAAATHCAFDQAETETLKVIRMTHDLPFLPEEEE